MAHAEETKVITAHVPLPLAERIDALATKLDRSRGWVMREALQTLIDQEDEKDRLTWAALASVDAGRVVAHEDVKAWAASLK